MSGTRVVAAVAVMAGLSCVIQSCSNESAVSDARRRGEQESAQDSTAKLLGVNSWTGAPFFLFPSDPRELSNGPSLIAGSATGDKLAVRTRNKIDLYGWVPATSTMVKSAHYFFGDRSTPPLSDARGSGAKEFMAYGSRYLFLVQEICKRLDNCRDGQGLVRKLLPMDVGAIVMNPRRVGLRIPESARIVSAAVEVERVNGALVESLGILVRYPKGSDPVTEPERLVVVRVGTDGTVLSERPLRSNASTTAAFRPQDHGMFPGEFSATGFGYVPSHYNDAQSEAPNAASYWVSGFFTREGGARTAMIVKYSATDGLVTMRRELESPQYPVSPDRRVNMGDFSIPFLTVHLPAGFVSGTATRLERQDIKMGLIISWWPKGLAKIDWFVQSMPDDVLRLTDGVAKAYAIRGGDTIQAALEGAVLGVEQGLYGTSTLSGNKAVLRDFSVAVQSPNQISRISGTSEVKIDPPGLNDTERRFFVPASGWNGAGSADDGAEPTGFLVSETFDSRTGEGRVLCLKNGREAASIVSNSAMLAPPAGYPFSRYLYSVDSGVHVPGPDGQDWLVLIGRNQFGRGVGKETVIYRIRFNADCSSGPVGTTFVAHTISVSDVFGVQFSKNCNYAAPLVRPIQSGREKTQIYLVCSADPQIGRSAIIEAQLDVTSRPNVMPLSFESSGLRAPLPAIDVRDFIRMAWGVTSIGGAQKEVLFVLAQGQVFEFAITETGNFPLRRVHELPVDLANGDEKFSDFATGLTFEKTAEGEFLRVFGALSDGSVFETTISLPPEVDVPGVFPPPVFFIRPEDQLHKFGDSNIAAQGGFGRVGQTYFSGPGQQFVAFTTKNLEAGFIKSSRLAGDDNQVTVLANRLAQGSAPTALALSSKSIAENAGANALVGSFTSTDPDPGSTFTYSLVDGAGSADNSSFEINVDQLRAKASLDFEAQNTHKVRVRTTDQGGLSFEREFVITVLNANEAPTALALSSTSVAENAAPNALVGTLSSTDPDPGDTFGYSLVEGAGSADNAQFSVNGNQLFAKASFDFEARKSLAVRIRTTDQGGLTYDQAFTITVTNAAETVPVKLGPLSRRDYRGADGIIAGYRGAGREVFTGFGASRTFGVWTAGIANTSLKITMDAQTPHGSLCPGGRVVTGFARDNRAGLLCSPVQPGVALRSVTRHYYPWTFGSFMACPANKVLIGNEPVNQGFQLVCATVTATR